MNSARLAKMESSQIGGKGSVRRKRKVHRSSSGSDQKLQLALKRMGVQELQEIEEVNLFTDDSKVIHFKAPKVQGNMQSNTYCISGNASTKQLAELLPGIINQVGQANLARLASAMGATPDAAGAADPAAAAAAAAGDDDDDDEDMPGLVADVE